MVRPGAALYGVNPTPASQNLLEPVVTLKGRIVQMTEMQELAYGERNGDATPRLRALDGTLQGAGFDAHLSTDITQAMWEKWVMLASGHPFHQFDLVHRSFFPILSVTLYRSMRTGKGWVHFGGSGCWGVEASPAETDLTP